MRTLWRICAKVREPVELPFGVVSGVCPGSGLLDGCTYFPMGRGGFGFFGPLGFSGPLVLTAFFEVIRKRKCI